MDEMTPFERQVADDVARRMGPRSPVDHQAIFAAIGTRAPRQRTRALFDATRLAAAAVVVVLLGGFLLAAFVTTQQGDDRLPAGVDASPSVPPMPAATGPDPVTSPKEADVKLRTPVATAFATIIAATPAVAQPVDGPMTGAGAIPGLVTETVASGVELVLGDSASHDLIAEKTERSKSVDQIAIAPDGTVWLRASVSDSDADRSPGLTVFALGQEGTYTIGDGIPETAGLSTLDAHVWLHIAPDGTPLLIGDRPGQLLSFDGERWVEHSGSRKIASDDRVLYLIEPADIPLVADADAERSDTTTESVDAEPGAIALEWRDGDGWSLVPEPGNLWVETPGGEEAGADDGDTGIIWFTDGVWPPPTYLEGIEIWEVASAPDGSLWVLAEGANLGGEIFQDLYRITNR